MIREYNFEAGTTFFDIRMLGHKEYQAKDWLSKQKEPIFHFLLNRYFYKNMIGNKPSKRLNMNRDVSIIDISMSEYV